MTSDDLKYSVCPCTRNCFLRGKMHFAFETSFGSKIALLRMRNANPAKESSRP